MSLDTFIRWFQIFSSILWLVLSIDLLYMRFDTDSIKRQSPRRTKNQQSLFHVTNKNLWLHKLKIFLVKLQIIQQPRRSITLIERKKKGAALFNQPSFNWSSKWPSYILLTPYPPSGLPLFFAQSFTRKPSNWNANAPILCLINYNHFRNTFKLSCMH